MRLIDADDLILTILTNDLCGDDNVDKAILNAPTIDAIPIEWIKKWLEAQERIVLISPPYYNQVRVPKMLEDWEKENDKSNSDNTRLQSGKTDT